VDGPTFWESPFSFFVGFVGHPWPERNVKRVDKVFPLLLASCVKTVFISDSRLSKIARDRVGFGFVRFATVGCPDRFLGYTRRTSSAKRTSPNGSFPATINFERPLS